jgi:hypothetical protein
LPYSGSVIASGKEDMGDEMRVRIIIESSVYKDAYLNQTFLERGAEETNDSLAKTYAFYSDEYSNEALSDGQIERIYVAGLATYYLSRFYQAMEILSHILVA